MKRLPIYLSLFASLLAACGPSPSSISYYPNASPTTAPSMAPGGLESLLTGQIVTSEEQQLRDIKTRRILLDFPIKVGVVFYQLGTRLDASDLETEFDGVQKALKDSQNVRETIQIPSHLISSAVTVDELRRLGARFQCDIIVMVTGSHRFERSKSQTISFFDSFSDKANYESQVKLDAIALDVYTGTLLSPFDAATKGGPFLLDASAPDYAQQAYAKQLETESKAWQALSVEAVERLQQLKADVEKNRASLPSPSPLPTSMPSPLVSSSPPVLTPSVEPTPAP